MTGWLLSSRVPTCATLTVYVLLVHGYHPYAEDGGVYVAGILKLLHPELFPLFTQFVTEHLRFSLFAPAVAGLVRWTHLSLPAMLLLLYLASVFSTLCAVWSLAASTRRGWAARVGAVALFAGALTVPVAGTSLILADPYLTARSFSTPLVLFALAFALDWTGLGQERRPHTPAPTKLTQQKVTQRGSSTFLTHLRVSGAGTVPAPGLSPRLTSTIASRPASKVTSRPASKPASGPVDGTRSRLAAALLCGACLLGAALLHPLMASYGLAAVLLLFAASIRTRKRRWQAYLACGVAAMAVASALQAAAAPDSAAYDAIAMTRYYWFPFRWQWYEQVGLVGPLAVLMAMIPRRLDRDDAHRMRATLARAALALAMVSLLVAVVFARAHFQAHLVARLQPLRCYTTVYALMLVLLGAWLGERVMRTHPWRWCTLLAALAGLMFFVQYATYPASPHLELPGRAASNPWVQAFVWIRGHTPADALFALPAHYITTDGEDAQCFRAIAQRSALPDYSKDGGEASITPSLTEAWVAGEDAQLLLDRETDAQRRASLLPLGVDWMVLASGSPTGLPCPFQNAAVKVCRLTGATPLATEP